MGPAGASMRAKPSSALSMPGPDRSPIFLSPAQGRSAVRPPTPTRSGAGGSRRPGGAMPLCVLTQRWPRPWWTRTPWNPDPPRLPTAPTCRPRPGQVQLSRPQQIPADKEPAFEGSPALLGSDKPAEKEKPPFLLRSLLLLRSGRLGACGPLPTAPLSITPRSQAPDRPLLRFGFQSGEPQPPAVKLGPYTWV